jgi:hypothetical protein
MTYFQALHNAKRALAQAGDIGKPLTRGTHHNGLLGPPIKRIAMMEVFAV